MDGLLLHSLNLQSIQLLVKDLAEVHDHRLVHLLPQVSPASEDKAQSHTMVMQMASYGARHLIGNSSTQDSGMRLLH